MPANSGSLALVTWTALPPRIAQFSTEVLRTCSGARWGIASPSFLT